MPFPTFATQDEVPEPFRDEYEEKDGAWVARMPEPEKGPTRKEIERRAQAAEKRAKEAEERAAQLETEREAAQSGIKPEDLQKLRATIEAEYRTKLDEKEKAIHELTFGAQLDALLADAGVLDLEDGRLVFGGRFELADGKLVPKEDKSVTPKAFIESRLMTEKPHHFRGTQAAGGGAGGSRSTGIPSGRASFEEFQKMSPTEKAAYAARHEQAA